MRVCWLSLGQRDCSWWIKITRFAFGTPVIISFIPWITYDGSFSVIQPITFYPMQFKRWHFTPKLNGFSQQNETLSNALQNCKPHYFRFIHITYCNWMEEKSDELVFISNHYAQNVHRTYCFSSITFDTHHLRMEKVVKLINIVKKNINCELYSVCT